MKTFKRILFAFFLGVIFGVWSFLSLETLLGTLLIVPIFTFLYYRFPKRDRPFLIKLCLLALCLRIVIMLFYYNFYLNQGYQDKLGPDGENYSQRGWYISRLIRDENPYRRPQQKEIIFSNHELVVDWYKGKLPPMNYYQVGFFSYMLGILYAAFGYCPLLLRMFNSIYSVLTGVLVYYIALELFNNKVGKIAMLLFLFTPSVFIHSMTLLKDPSTIFALTLFVWLLIKFIKTVDARWLIFSSIPLIVIEIIRPRFCYFLIAFVLLIIFLKIQIRFIYKAVFLLFIALILYFFPEIANPITYYFDPDIFFSRHIGTVATAGVNYLIFPKEAYKSSYLVGIGSLDIILAFLKGVFHFLFEPFISRINSSFSFLAFFQTSFLYFLIPAGVISALISLKKNFSLFIIVILFLAMLILFFAVNEGNVGTAFRHRDMVMPYLLIFGVAGIIAKLSGNDSIF